MKEITFWDMVLRLALAMLCGGVLGYGRSRKQRPAGLRTYMLVCLGAACAVLQGLRDDDCEPEDPYAGREGPVTVCRGGQGAREHAA